MITYFLKVILCSAVFIFTYKILLENAKIHRFNRYYLFTVLLLSFIIPAITFSTYTSPFPATENETLNADFSAYSQVIQILPSTDSSNNGFSILFTIYLVITAFLIFRFFNNIKNILSKARNSRVVPYKGSKIVLLKEDLTPHSFLHYIFISNEEYCNGTFNDEILVHEYAHIQQKHSYDILLIEIIHTFFWFNPFLFFYRKAIQLNHEFLADQVVIDTYQNIVGYQSLLIDKASKNKTYSLTSQFNYSITKKRLIMMAKTKSLANAICRQIAIIPVLTLSIFLFSTKSIAQETSVLKAKDNVAPSSQEGVSQELLNEYDQIVNKTKTKNGIPSFYKFSDADKSRLETIYLSMSKEQQAKQIVIFMPAPAPLPRIVPTKKQIESWKNSKVYGLWIDNIRVNNSELTKYQNTDFSQVMVSKLGKNTVNYGKHYYQVNLMTNKEYESYYKKSLEGSHTYHLAVRMLNKQR